MTSAATSSALLNLSRLRGVRCALLTSLRDAIPIASTSHVDVDVEALAAIAASLYRCSRKAAVSSPFGQPHRMMLDASGGRLAAAGSHDALVVVLAERDTHPGLIRVSLQRALEELGEG